MTEPFDTGDVVSYGPEILVVACCHDEIVRPCGYPPDRTIPASKCTLQSKATASQRIEQLRMLAQSSGTGHRPRCARDRLEQEVHPQ